MRHHIEKIRQQPEHVRHIIAYTVSGVCTIALFAVWFSSLSDFSQKPVNQFAVQKVQQQKVETLKTPWQTATANMANAFESVRGITQYVESAFGKAETYTAPPQYVEVIAK